MKKIKNDYGKWVNSIGAPNSRERVKAKYPKLIERLKVAYDETPVCSIIKGDLIAMGFDESTGKHISDIVRQELCDYCKKPGIKPSHFGSPMCESGSIASGGTKSHCSCDVCF